MIRRTRPSKLSESVRQEISRRTAGGEPLRDLAKEFKVSVSTIHRWAAERLPRIRKVAATLVNAERELEALPLVEQSTIRSVADQMKGIARNLTHAASNGSHVASKLSSIARKKADMVDEESETDDLKPIAALIETGNRAAQTGLSMMQAAAKPVNQVQEQSSRQISFVVLDASDGD